MRSRWLVVLSVGTITPTLFFAASGQMLETFVSAGVMVAAGVAAVLTDQEA